MPATELAKDGRTTLPLRHVQRAQPPSDPAIHAREHARGIGQPEILIPADQIATACRHDLGDTAPTAARRDRPNPVLQFRHRLGGYAPPDRAAGGHPKAEPEERAL